MSRMKQRSPRTEKRRPGQRAAQRFLAAALSAAMVLGMSTAVLAAPAQREEGIWYLDDGDIAVTAKADGHQYLTQGDRAEVLDDHPVISQREGSTANTVTLTGTAGQAADATLRGVTIAAAANKAPVSVVGGSARIALAQANRLTGGSGRPGIQVAGDSALTLVGSGALTVQGGSSAAGIGSGARTAAGNIAIVSGDITAIGGSRAAGIGGGDGSFGGTIAISGGKINATGNGGGAGIGGGSNGCNPYEEGSIAAYISITSGQITAAGGTQGAGIGGGFQRIAHVNISGGTIEATGGSGAAGIGSGEYPFSAKGRNQVTITAGDITAIGGGVTDGSFGGAGIGCGMRSSSLSSAGDITLGTEGGSDSALVVRATGGPSSAGIGGGNGNNSGAISILSGTITAKGGNSGAGIGGGNSLSSDNKIERIAISGGRVEAFGGSSGAGIGGGRAVDGGVIALQNSARVKAVGGPSAAAIGGGGYADGSTISIDSTVALEAYASGEKWAIDRKNSDLSGVKGILNGRFDGFSESGSFVKADNELTLDAETALQLLDGSGQVTAGLHLPINSLVHKSTVGRRVYHSFALSTDDNTAYLRNSDSQYGDRYTDYPSADGRDATYPLSGSQLVNIDHIRFTERAPSHLVSYTVEHWVEGEQSPRATETVSAQVPLHQNTLAVQPVTSRDIENHQFLGTDPETLPEAVESGSVIRALYGADESKVKTLSYTVEHWVEGESAPRDVGTVTAQVWAGAADTLAVAPLSPRTYTGYTPDHTSPAELPDTIENGGVIALYYWQDDSQTKTLSYTVEHWLDGEDAPRETQRVERQVWAGADDTLAVEAIAPNQYAGYTFRGYAPEQLPATVRSGAVIRVLYSAVEIPVVPPVDPPAPDTPVTPPTPVSPVTPVVTPPDATPAGPVAPVTPIAPIAPETPEVEIPDPETPEAQTPAVDVEIPDPETPQSVFPSWALLNLILAISTAVASLLLLVFYFIGKKKREEEREEGAPAREDEAEKEQLKRKGFWRVFSLLPAIGSIVAFLLTENIHNPMVFTDRWTLLMALIAAIQLVVTVLSIKRRKDSGEREDPDAATAQ
ncbi:hypothetical protein [Bittarella massiliensis (ex Durand et al. 2017)]|uniref:Uncharacterized protein n=1 Tax=Bittarella massiliensis (ex Durand et al. 2017) TaxID=1720313 RepID=A0ABW9X097_9FIRM|nr:hypothetical protein [Bittarella massiliensis (ex Durand et al. 2017)]MZL70732.1 hypothetical protein [Bittarella massiliensis (ex Durand et al. 2017)]MZL81598.1 hypothetical protein [Bittarella massiliensis (ex Durand et al. 2017)]